MGQQKSSINGSATVVFGSNIRIGACLNAKASSTYIEMVELNDAVKMGQRLTGKESIKDSKVILEFDSIDSIVALENALELCKNALKTQHR